MLSLEDAFTQRSGRELLGEAQGGKVRKWRAGGDEVSSRLVKATDGDSDQRGSMTAHIQGRGEVTRN